MQLFMHRTAVIDDVDVLARRDDRQKVARKRKVAQRGRRERSGWGNTRMYVPQTNCLLRTLMQE